MRLVGLIFVMGSFAFVGCAGDSSVVMSVWDDSGAGGDQPPVGGAGGDGGQSVSHQGGSSGGSASSISVPGGTRDLATTQCTAASGGTCPVPGSYLTCIKTSCGASLAECYSSDGISRAVGGQCMSYANCMLACPCDAGRSKCEGNCQQNFATYDPDCSSCLIGLLTCSSKFGCTFPTSCSASVSGAAGSSGSN
jgi:hypothetical protein